LRELWATIVGRRAVGQETPNFRTVLDLGTEQAKALVVESRGRDSLVIGAGTARHEVPLSPDGGKSVDFRALLPGCDRALRQAEDMTKGKHEGQVVPDWVVVCVPNCLTVGRTHTITSQRSNPRGRVSESELRDVLKRAQRLALRELSAEVKSSRLGHGGKLDLLETSVSGTWIDGRSVTSPVGLQGEKLTAAVFNVVMPGSCLRVVKMVTDRLGLEILKVVSGWRGLALAGGQKDAVCLDVGGVGTDAVIIRAGKAWSTASLAVGGCGFTAHIAEVLDISSADAERSKVAYGLGRLDGPLYDAVRTAVRQALEDWAASLERALHGMCGSGSLPQQFVICGGSSVLPDLPHVLRSHPWRRLANGSLHPEVTVMRPREIPGVLDRTGVLAGQQYVAPMAVAGCSSGAGEAVSSWDKLLRGVKRPKTFVDGGGRS
jgi:cell division ATPase FtsA